MIKQRLWVLLLSSMGGLGLLVYWGGWLQALRPQTTPASSVSGATLSLNMAEVGHMAGLADAVFISDTLIYAGLGAEMAILDVTNPYTPTRLGYVALPALVTDVFVVETTAYVAAAESGLHLYNTTNPAQPIYLSTITTTGQVQTVLVQGNVAYLGVLRTSAPFGQIISVDISNPTQPVVLGTRQMNGPVYSLALVGNLLYAAADYNGFRVLNVSNPAQITVEGGLATPGWARGVVVQGNYAYVIQTNCSGECNGYLSIINITNPASPAAESHTLLPGSGAGLTVSGVYAYLADRNGGLRIMQVSNPTAPMQVSWLDTPGVAWDVVYHNDLVYVADESGGVRIYNVFNPNTIVPLGAYAVTDRPSDVTIVGSWAYLSEWGGVRVADVSDPTAPVNISFVPLPDTAEHVAVYGNYAYVAAGDTGGIRILDITNPAQPGLVGFYDTPGNAHRVVIQGDRAYVADGNQGLRILSLSNPTSPTLLGIFDTPGEARDVALQGDYAFVADHTQGIRVLDVSNAAAPVEVGSYIPFGQAFSITLHDTAAYVAALNGWLVVLDVSDPTTPTLVTTVNVGAWVNQVAVRDNTLYAAASSKGLRVYDIRNPFAPVEMAFLDTGGNARSITVSGSTLFVAEQSGGVVILEEAYAISGHVTDHVGVPQAGVLLQASNGVTATTQSDGAFTLNGFAGGTHTVMPFLDGFRYTPTSRNVTVGPSKAGVNFVAIPAPISVTLSSSAAATLIYTDVQGLPTRFVFPAGTVANPTTVVVTPTLFSLAGGLGTFGHNFDMAAYQGGSIVPNFTFAIPVQVVMRYSTLDLGSVYNEEEMYLGRWDGAGWPDAAATCTPPATYDHNLVTNQIAVGICQTGSFAFLLPVRVIYLPLLLKS